ncbi:MAG: thiol:disulfide interchange protein DsbA/DsbL [Ideonella sp.]|nr:thiol:disulfide interchange protein DsbA/DsbL [Ideonella sp.]
MKRREFCLTTTSLATVAALSSPAAQAQSNPVEGTHYIKLAQPVPVAASGKIEVVEFFWYGCPHCFALEPFLEPWHKKLPADVAFRRVPAGFTPQHEFHQRVFYAMEALGILEAMHRRFFNAMQIDRKPMRKDEDIAAFFTSVGQDGAKVVATMKSFGVVAKAKQAKQLGEGYRIDGVPAIGVHGRFYTSSVLAGNSHERALGVADYLIAQVRKGPR